MITSDIKLFTAQRYIEMIDSNDSWFNNNHSLFFDNFKLDSLGNNFIVRLPSKLIIEYNHNHIGALTVLNIYYDKI